jgi:hypothetical protein
MRRRTCSACLQPDHEVRRCPAMHGPVGGRVLRSRGGQAVLYALTHNVALWRAAAHFGVSHNAVRMAYLRAFGEDAQTHTKEGKEMRRDAAVALAGTGLHAKEIAAACGLSPANLKRVLWERGVTLTSARRERAEREAA